MPLYPYRCTQCGHRFEKIQRFNAKPEKVCPKCGGALERLLTAPGLQFKGSGWYVNDYAGKSGATPETATSEKKTETKGAPASSEASSASGTAASSSATSSAPAK